MPPCGGRGGGMHITRLFRVRACVGCANHICAPSIIITYNYSFYGLVPQRPFAACLPACQPLV